MGQGQSSSAAADDAPQKADYYDLLGVERAATDEEIKKAYRRKALELHPDRNYGKVEEATMLFAEIQTAYEVLSDPQERAWYDSHRDVLLRGDSAAGNGDEFSYNIRMTTAFEVQKLMMKFNGKLEFSDAPSGFFGGLNDFFRQLAKEEDIVCQWEDEESIDYPDFGSKDDDYEDVVRPFYAFWTGFATKKSYVWKDHFRLSDAPDRRIRRLMEKENKKIREEAVQEYNDAVRSLIAFVRKRDPRVQDNQKSEAERQKILKHAAAAQAARARAQREAQFKDIDTSVPSWSKSQPKDALEGGFSSESDIEEHEYECVVCDKTFKSEAQFKAHEKSKKHQKLLKQLKREMREEGHEEEADLERAESEQAEEHVARDEGTEDEDESVRTAPTIRPDQNHSQKFAEKPRPETNGHITDEPSDEASESENDDYADRGAVQDRLAGQDQNPLVNKLNDLSFEGTPATTDTESSIQPKVGAAKTKRAKKAAKQSNGEETSSSAFSCSSCRANFPSKTKLFDHLKEKPSHAAPVAQKKGAKGGKKKR